MRTRNRQAPGVILLLAALPAAWCGVASKSKKQETSSLDRYIREIEDAPRPEAALSPGSLYSSTGRYGELARDQRASQLNDLVTIVIYDKASAISKGATSANRKSQAKASITAMGGPVKTPGPLSSLADLSGETKLDGQGQTSRENELKATLSARVKHVLPNGDLLVEGTKDIMVNSERQRVSIRGILRAADISPANRIASDRLAELEVRVDGKGVVNDAIRRPGFLYRLILGILPF